MSGDVTITIVDGGGAAVVVPFASTQLVMGCCSAGTPNTIVATKSPATLQTTCGYGPGVEAAALTCLTGGTVLFVPLTIATKGTASACVYTGTGTLSSSVPTLTLDSTVGAFDTYYVKFKFVAGGTIGTTGITFQVSLDAGRTYGAVIALLAATSYIIPNTGITVNFTPSATAVANDFFTFATVEPLWNTAGVLAAMNAVKASPYAQIGWGSSHLVGKASGSDVATVEGYLDTWAIAPTFIYTRCFFSARDASPNSTAWGGSSESETAWMTQIENDFASVSAKRACVGAAYWNMPSAFINAAAGAPRYRRSVSYAAAARSAAIPPQRLLSRVKDGSLSQIVVDPTSDPTDGFIYHNEVVNPGLTATRFMSTRTRIRQPGVFIDEPNLMSPYGSVFTLLPLGTVIDVACGIMQQVGQLEINDDLRLTPAGTLDPRDALSLQQIFQTAIDTNMTSKAMISSAVVVVDQNNNVQSTGTVNWSLTITSRGYVLEENGTIQFSSPGQA